MKLTPFLFLLIQSISFLGYSIKYKEQPFLQYFEETLAQIDKPIQNQDNTATQPSKFTTQDICNSLIDTLVVFGNNATWTYGQCPNKYFLLGKENSLIQKDQPSCFLNIVPALCDYQIERERERPHPSDLRYFVTHTLLNCIKVIDFSYR